MLTLLSLKIFYATVLLTVLSGGASLGLAQQPTLTPYQTSIFETCQSTWNMGIGAIFGLLGARATSQSSIQDQSDEDSTDV